MRAPKVPRRYKIYDVLHKTAVTGLLMFTGLTLYIFVTTAHNFVTVTKPRALAERRRVKAEEIEKEQKEKEEERLRKQRALEKII